MTFFLSSEKLDSLLQVVPPPDGQLVELVARHAERQLEVGVREVLLQVAPVDVRRHLVVAGEEGVQRVGLVLAGEGQGRLRPHGEVGPGEQALAVGAGRSELGVVSPEVNPLPKKKEIISRQW